LQRCQLLCEAFCMLLRCSGVLLRCGCGVFQPAQLYAAGVSSLLRARKLLAQRRHVALGGLELLHGTVKGGLQGRHALRLLLCLLPRCAHLLHLRLEVAMSLAQLLKFPRRIAGGGNLRARGAKLVLQALQPLGRARLTLCILATKRLKLCAQLL
jgi:hypothetical protein